MEPKLTKSREELLKAALEKAKSKSLPEYATHRWNRQELKNLLKSKRRNPFLAPKPNPRSYEFVKCLGSGVGGATAVALLDKYVTHQVPARWHYPTHALVAGGSLLLPWAGFGGAAFYGLISETYYRFVTQGILAKAKKEAVW